MGRGRKATFGPNAGLYCYTVWDSKGFAVRQVYARNVKEARTMLREGEVACTVADPNGNDL